GDWPSNPGAVEALRPQVMAVAARYILQARARGGQPADPVARFHLGNGAAAHRLNWPADLSASAQKTAHGLMINYLYELDRIEDRHEAFIRDGTVAHGPQLAEALKG
ncbi:MCD, Malonyl-CoA decarboxylase MCD, partial [Paracoccus liaowanqingii]